MQERQEMADAQPLDAVQELLAHGLGAAGDDEAALDEILVCQRAQIDLTGRVLHRQRQRVVFETAGDRHVVRRRVQQVMEEILRVTRVFLGLLVGLGHADELQEAQAVGIGVAALFRGQFPIAFDHGLGVPGAEIAQVAEAMVVIDDVFRGRGDARAGNPDRRMRLLDRDAARD